MKVKGGPSVILILILGLVIICFYAYNRTVTYNSISIITKDVMALEYGSANYDIKDFIEKVDGEVVSIQNEVDTNVVGKQEVILKVQKEDIVKEFPLMISVVDTVSPVIEVKEETVTITSGDDYCFLSNIASVRDEIDGDIPYVSEIGEDSVFYYHFDYDASTIDNVGDHEVHVMAKDKNGNLSTVTFILHVVAPKIVYYQPVYANVPANGSAGNLVSIAYSYLGYPYASGANGPYAFDCSGFVQYVYRQAGISVSRSTSTQIHDGVGVSYADMQPGDIISWGYSNGAVTHSALYVGDGKMIHAANYGTGVILSSVSGWLSGSGTQILSVRRIQG